MGLGWEVPEGAPGAPCQEDLAYGGLLDRLVGACLGVACDLGSPEEVPSSCEDRQGVVRGDHVGHEDHGVPADDGQNWVLELAEF